jgi:hypothetical protein
MKATVLVGYFLVSLFLMAMAAQDCPTYNEQRCECYGDNGC